MIRAVTCFVAEGVITDVETKQVSAFGLLESVQASSFPVPLQRLALFCMWERLPADPATCGAEFTLSLNGRELARQIIDVDFSQFLRSRTTVRFEGLTLAEPGNLIFRLAIPGHGVAEWVITASVAAQAASAPVGPAESHPVYDSGQVSISLGTVNVNRR